MKMPTAISRKSELYYKIFSLMSIAKGGSFSFTDNEKRLISLLYEKRDDLHSKGVDINTINMILFSKETRKEIIAEMDIPYNSYNNIISSIKHKNFIVDKKLHPFWPSVMNHDIKEPFEFTMNIKLDVGKES